MNNLDKKNRDIDTSVLLPLFKELKAMFSGFFDQNWFFILLDNSDIETRTLNDILDLLEQDFSLVENNDDKFVDLTLLLSKLLLEVTQILLPVIREKLCISGFQKSEIAFAQNEYVRRILIAQVFPDNLKRLEEIVRQLRATLKMDELKLEDKRVF